MPRLRTCSRAALTAALALVVAAGCSDDDSTDDAGSGTSAPATSTSAATTAPGATTTTALPGDTTGPDGTAPPSTASTSTTPATTSPTTTPTTTPPTGGCVADAPDAPPAGAATGAIPDVDGDGRRDTAWVGSDPDGGRSVGIVTAGGVGSEVEIDSGSPVGLSVLVADADATPPAEVFVSDNRTVYLFAFVDCTIQPVLNPQGEQYLFDLGFRGNGTGVGCVEVDGRQELVGLLAGPPDGETVPWTRTVIELDGLSARNGRTDSGTFTSPADDAAIELLYTVSCGDRTIADDGVTQGPPG